MQDTIPTSSLFQNHLLTVQSDKPQLHITNYDYWIGGILLSLYILFVWLYVSNRKKLNQIIREFYISRTGNRDQFSIGNRASVFLSVFFVATLTIFINQILAYYGLHLFTYNPVFLGIVTALFILIAYGVKFLSIYILGYIFKVQKAASEYSLSVFLFCNVVGLFMLPVVVCLTLMKQVSPVVFIYTGMGLLVVFMAIRVIRTLILGFNNSRISKFYLFMYLCTLEILPFIILAKLFILNVK